MSFKNKLKDGVIAPYNKYNLSQEKLGQVISADKDKNTCTVTYKNVDGIKMVRDNVPVKGYLTAVAGNFPKKGDYVELQEVGKNISIRNVIDKDLLVDGEKETGDIYSSGASYAGYIGI